VITHCVVTSLITCLQDKLHVLVKVRVGKRVEA
jgi:hypothetical protein